MGLAQGLSLHLWGSYDAGSAGSSGGMGVSQHLRDYAGIECVNHELIANIVEYKSISCMNICWLAQLFEP